MGGRLHAAGLATIAVAAVAVLTGEPASTAPADGNGDVFRGSPAIMSCVESYSAMTLAKRGFAFDGTVTTIDEGDGTTPYITVTFRVHRWYRNGSRDHALVAMFPPGSPPTGSVRGCWCPASPAATGGRIWPGHAASPAGMTYARPTSGAGPSIFPLPPGYKVHQCSSDPSAAAG
jgi:hypothetical protein